jgi:acyl carrier protein
VTDTAQGDATARTRQAFIDALGVDADTDFETLAYGKHEKWDSIAHMALVAELEDAFEIMLDTDDVIAMSSYPVALEILRRYGVSV